MIVVTGATGELGRRIVECLANLVPASTIVVTMRDPNRAKNLAKLGMSVRKVDFSDPKSLAIGFAGASQVLVVSTDTIGKQALTLHRTAITAARDIGAKRVLYTAHMGARPDSPFHPMPDHATTERALEESGIAFTSLCHGFYAASALQLIQRGLESGSIELLEDGKVSWTTHDDLAEADAIILAEEGRIDGISSPLTAPEAFDMSDLAAIASELSGREVKRIVITDHSFRDSLVGHRVPDHTADLLLGIFKASRRGDFAATDPTLETLLGRRPRTMRDVLAAKYKG